MGGVKQLYRPSEKVIGRMCEKRSDLDRGVYVTETGFTSRWFCKRRLVAEVERAVAKLPNAKDVVLRTNYLKVHGMDVYGLFVLEPRTPKPEQQDKDSDV